MTSPTSADPFRYYRRLTKVRAYVEANLSRQITLLECAQVARNEATHFSRFFLEKTGTHFSSWLSRQRIARAVLLFAERNYSVAEVSSMVGYGDVRTFQRAFKRHLGMTPSDGKRNAALRSPIFVSLVANGVLNESHAESSERFASALSSKQEK